ncbi:hypothetical protein QBC35DRAFT_249818 [Podospora australis]|uniref:Uncharacterized protein n=1 Tax=Podospora australis TaxID=1536484 RepID=A0AAN7AHT0_9PEZI|nr:hypothetical protein QBC35DRAFT_249818 [Podospora australis]
MRSCPPNSETLSHKVAGVKSSLAPPSRRTRWGPNRCLSLSACATPQPPEFQSRSRPPVSPLHTQHGTALRMNPSKMDGDLFHVKFVSFPRSTPQSATLSHCNAANLSQQAYGTFIAPKMYINRATFYLATACAVVVPCLSLPFNEPGQVVEPRATYAVVPINGGGPGKGGAGSGTGSSGEAGGPGNGSGSGSGAGSGPGKLPPSPVAPVTVTVVQTPPAQTAFHTVLMTSPPKSTDRVTDTVVITKTVEIVNIKPDTTSSLSTTTSTASAGLATISLTTPSLLQPSTLTSILTSTTSRASTISILPGSSTTTSPAAVTSAPLTTVPPASETLFTSGSTTYDNGQWHTSYPAWSGNMLRRRFHVRPLA